MTRKTSVLNSRTQHKETSS